MTFDDECEQQRPTEDGVWRGEFRFPDAKMGTHFQEWWEKEGWWSYRSWHDKTFGSNSEWEQFARRLWGQAPIEERKRLKAAVVEKR